MFTFRIWHKLFLATAAAVVVALIVMLVLTQQNFSRGFSEYLQRWEAIEVDNLSRRLGDAYAQYGDWSFLSLPGQAQQRLLGVRLGPPPGAPKREHEDRRGKNRRDGRPPPPAGSRPPPPRRVSFEPPGMPAPARNILDSGSRVAVANLEDRQLAGPREVMQSGTRHEVRSNGVPVGYLFVTPAPKLERDLDYDFAQRQSRSLLLIGAVIFVLAAPLIYLITRRLTAPLQQVTAATRVLATGGYDHRIDIRSGDEIQQLGEDFNQMAQALESQRNLQRRWLAEISHELRTPLAVLSGEIEALRDGIRQPTPAALDSLDQETRRLTRLVEDLYFLSVSDAGGTRYESDEVDLKTLVEHSATVSDGFDLNVELELPENAWVVGDADRLRQVLDNLMSNSQRYTDRPGRLVVALQSHGDRWRLTWADSGPGLEGEELERIFDPLYRAERSRARRFGGAGLGLAIVRSIVEAHQGTITAGPSQLGGVKFEIQLAKAKQHE